MSDNRLQLPGLLTTKDFLVGAEDALKSTPRLDVTQRSKHTNL